MSAQPLIVGRRLLLVAATALLWGCPRDQEPARAPAGDATDATDVADTGAVDVDSGGDSEAQPYHVTTLTPDTVRRIDHRPFGEPLFVVFSETSDAAIITVYDSNHEVSSHMVPLEDGAGRWVGRVTWWSQDTDKFAVELRHPNISSDYLQWKPSSRRFDAIVEGVRARETNSEGYFPSGFGYAYDTETDDLLVLDFRQGIVARQISEHSRQSTFLVEPDTGRAIYNVIHDTWDRELLAYDPHTDELRSLGSSTQSGYRFLESGRVMYISPSGASTFPVKLWEFGQQSSRTVWQNSEYSPRVNPTEWLVVFSNSLSDTNYQRISVFDERQDQILFTDDIVDISGVWIHPAGTMIVYPRFSPRDDYGYDAETVIRMLETDETFVVAERDLHRSDEPVFAPEGPAVAIPLEGRDVVLWSYATQQAHLLETIAKPYMWPSPEGDFWVVENWTASPYSALKAFDVRTEEMFVLGDGPDISHVNVGTDCNLLVAPHGNQIVTRYGRDSQWGERKTALWRRSTEDTTVLIDGGFHWGCPTFIDDNDTQRGVALSSSWAGGLTAWEGDDISRIETDRAVEQFAVSPKLEDVYYTSYDVDADSSLTQLDRWHFQTRQAHPLSTAVVNGAFIHHDSDVAFLENPGSCNTSCRYELRVYSATDDDTPVLVHEEAVDLETIIDGHVFFYAWDNSGVPGAFLMVAAPSSTRD